MVMKQIQDGDQGGPGGILYVDAEGYCDNFL